MNPYTFCFTTTLIRYFNSGCGNTLFTESYGHVTSPGWPNPYGSNKNCSNIIWDSQQDIFRLHYEGFNIHSCVNCSCDWLEVQNARVIYKYNLLLSYQTNLSLIKTLL